MNTFILRASVLLLALLSETALRAELATFVLDPARSSVTVSGNAAGAALQAQGAGSLTTLYAGTVVLDIGATEVRFPGGSRVFPQEINSWQPGPAGADGSAPASYGGKAQIGSGFFGISAVVATRRLSLDALSAPIPFIGGSFTADGLQFQFVATNNPVLDYHTSGLLNQRDSLVLSGLATNKVAGASTLVTDGQLQTLTIPVDAVYSFELLTPDDSVLLLTGKIVATRILSAAPLVIVIAPIAPGATSMTLSWPTGFKLQKASRLVNPDWADTGASSPVTIPFVGAGEYFQLVPQ